MLLKYRIYVKIRTQFPYLTNKLKTNPTTKASIKLNTNNTICNKVMELKKVKPKNIKLKVIKMVTPLVPKKEKYINKTGLIGRNKCALRLPFFTSWFMALENLSDSASTNPCTPLAIKK